MYKMQLEKGLGNQYYIKKTAYNYSILRIVDVYIDNKRLDREKYHMEGPRAVRLHIEAKYPHRVFASITSVMRGNRFVV